MTTYLQHYGISGQKKGTRRYQNEDGTYTEEGKVRKREAYRTFLSKVHSSSSGVQKKVGPVAKNIAVYADKQKNKSAIKKAQMEAQTYSDAELKRLVQRYSLENAYIRETTNVQHRGEETVNNILLGLEIAAAVSGLAVSALDISDRIRAKKK